MTHEGHWSVTSGAYRLQELALVKAINPAVQLRAQEHLGKKKRRVHETRHGEDDQKLSKVAGISIQGPTEEKRWPPIEDHIHGAVEKIIESESRKQVGSILNGILIRQRGAE